MSLKFQFTPTSLRHAGERVRRDHPVPASVVDDPEIARDAPKQHLITQMMAQSSRSLEEWVRGLNSLDRAVLPLLLVNEDASVRARAAECFSVVPTQAASRYLWQAFCLFHNSQRQIANISLDRASVFLFTKPQRLLLRAACSEHPNPAAAFWQLQANSRQPAVVVRRELEILEGSMLESAIVEELLNMKDARAWDSEQDALFNRAFLDQPLGKRAQVMSRAHEAWATESNERLKARQKARVMVECLLEYETLLEHIRGVSPAASTWWKQLSMRWNLELFFEDLGDNERARFWALYVEQMHDVYVQHEEQRIFMDFGGFGVIEFGQVGNAGYIYESSDFSTFLARAKSVQLKNHELKDKDLVLERIRHGRGWTRKTPGTLRYWQIRFSA